MASGARAAATAALDAGRHVAWYLRYRIDGDSRARGDDGRPPPRRDRA